MLTIKIGGYGMAVGSAYGAVVAYINGGDSAREWVKTEYIGKCVWACVYMCEYIIIYTLLLFSCLFFAR